MQSLWRWLRWRLQVFPVYMFQLVKLTLSENGKHFMSGSGGKKTIQFKNLIIFPLDWKSWMRTLKKNVYVNVFEIVWNELMHTSQIIIPNSYGTQMSAMGASVDVWMWADGQGVPLAHWVKTVTWKRQAGVSGCTCSLLTPIKLLCNRLWSSLKNVALCIEKTQTWEHTFPHDLTIPIPLIK